MKLFPKWFDSWNKDNPVTVTKLVRPAVGIGVAGGAVVVAAFFVSFGQPYATESLQTGPRGTGMHVARFESEIATPDPTIAGFTVSTQLEPGSVDDSEARGLLGDPSDEEFARLVGAMRHWTGIPTLFEDAEDYQTRVAYEMIQMTQSINENWAGHVNINGEAGVTCYTCHRGNAVPDGAWVIRTPTVEAMAGWSANQNRVTPVSGFTSLPSDALEAYLVNYQTIGVNDLESLAPGIPGEDGYASIQDTERTYSLMNHFANSMGANCTLCHNTRAPWDATQATPQWSTASLGIAMTLELNNDWLLPTGALLPEHRLGPQGDVPKAACNTCHLGYIKPLQGLNVLDDYQALAAAPQ